MRILQNLWEKPGYVQETRKPITGHNCRRCIQMRGKQLRTGKYQPRVWHRGTELSRTILINDEALSAKRGRSSGEDRSENRPQG
jgi:hypothetical protein